MVDLGSLLGEVSPAQAREFLKTWYGGRDGYVILTKISSAGRHVVWSTGMTVPNMLALFEGNEEAAAQGLTALCSDGGGNWNVYISCSTHREDPTGGEGKRRGGKSTIDAVHGVWLDLDVKNESFNQGPEQIDAFIRSLEINPTMVVDSGSGGRHVYWRFTEPVPRDEGEQVCDAWWAYCQEQAGDVYIDKVTTSDRIMRLPGTLRWPKRSGEDVGRVALLYSQGERYSVDRIVEVAGGAWQRYLEKVRAVKERVQLSAERAQIALVSMSESDGGWGDLLTLAGIEQIFNETVSWDRILIPAGWRYVGTDYEGRRHWARPGQDAKSAHTDYPPSPHVMNLFSNAPQTRLSSLHSAGVVLSKLVVYGALYYDGDMERLMKAFIAGTFDGVSQALL